MSEDVTHRRLRLDPAVIFNMGDYERASLLQGVDDHDGEDPLQEIEPSHSDDYDDEPAASSSDMVELSDIGADAGDQTGKKKKKRRVVKKKKKLVKKRAVKDGDDQAPVNPDELEEEGEGSDPQQRYDRFMPFKTLWKDYKANKSRF